MPLSQVLAEHYFIMPWNLMTHTLNLANFSILYISLVVHL